MIRSFSITDIGKMRKMNQDYIFSSDSPVGRLPDLYLVADGMGGQKAGDYASRYAVTQLVREVQDSRESRPRDVLEIGLHHVNRSLHRESVLKKEYEGCGTTMVAAVIADHQLIAANVGDSRLYLVHTGNDGRSIRQVTVDHSLVEEMVLAGSLTAEKARNHPEKNVITRAVGAEKDLDVDFFTVTLQEGDVVLLCTDGLTNMVEDGKILEIVSEKTGLGDRARHLVQEANDCGGRDNVSVTLIEPFPQENNFG